MLESIPREERVVFGALDFNGHGHVGEGKRRDDEVMAGLVSKKGTWKDRIMVGFAKRIQMAMVMTYIQNREETRVTYKSEAKNTSVDCNSCRKKHSERD